MREDSAVVAVDDAGGTVRLPRPARRIVSLVPSATETLLATGARDRIVARTNYDTDPRLTHLPSVGGGLDPSLEALTAVRPDLVIAWAEAGGPALRERVGELGIPVFGIAPQDTADTFVTIARLGELTGQHRSADSLAAHLRATFDSVHTSVAGLPGPTVLYVMGADPLMTAGSGSFVAQLIGIAGGRTIFPDLDAPWPQISLEAVIERQPEVIVWAVGHERDAEVSHRRVTSTLDAPAWEQLEAVRCGRVVLIDRELLNRPGPRMGEAARALRDALHRSTSAGCR